MGFSLYSEFMQFYSIVKNTQLLSSSVLGKLSDIQSPPSLRFPLEDEFYYPVF